MQSQPHSAERFGSQRDFWWHRDVLRRFVLRGGGDEEFFELVYCELTEKFEGEHQAINAGTFHADHGSLFYLVSGRKP